MGITLHGENATKAKDVAALYNEMGEALKADEKELKDLDFLPIDLPVAEDPKNPSPEILAARMEVRERIIALYKASLGSFCTQDGRSIVRDYKPEFGNSRRTLIDEDDLLGLRATVERFLDLNDPSFNVAVSEKDFGMVAAMAKTLNFGAK